MIYLYLFGTCFHFIYVFMIIEKYKDNPYCMDKGTLLPVPCNQKMNSYLKEIADLCGIKKNLTTHTASHSDFSFLLKFKHLQIFAA